MPQLAGRRPRAAAWVAALAALLAALPALQSATALNVATLRCREPIMVGGGVDSGLLARSTSTSASMVGTSDCRLAIDRLAEAESSRPVTGPLRRWRILLAITSRQFASAFALAREGISERTHDSWDALVTGTVQHARGEYAAAAETWLQASPSGDGINLIIWHLLRGGQPGEAAEYAKEVVRRHPDRSDAHLTLAEVFFHAGKRQEALDEYAIAFASPPASFPIPVDDAAFHRAQLLDEAKRYDEAVVVLARVLEQRPDYPPYLAFLARLYSYKGDYVNAERRLDRLIVVSPTSGSAWEYGQYDMRQQRYVEALPWLRRAVDADVGVSAGAFGDLGAAYLALGDRSRAVSALREALRRDSGNSTFRQWLVAAAQDGPDE